MKFYIFLSIIYFIILVLFLGSCIEEFNPPSQGFENLLVVEAYLADKKEASEVILSRSFPLDTTAWIPESGARVSIADFTGEEFRMSEIKDGIYQFRDNINTTIGQDYQLHIITADGRNYRSDWVTLQKTPSIDSVIWRYEEKPELGLQGVQIYVNTHDPRNQTWYYRWYWEDTWTFHTAYKSDIYWADGQILPREKQVYTCWKNTRSLNINIASSKALDQDIIYNYPLLYVDNNSDRLAMRYSLLVKQYALSEESYNYWSEMEKITENLGTLFDPLPSTLNGNIRNVENENEIVLGYFDAATVEEERIFIDNLDLPFMRYKDYYENCADTITGYGGIAELVLSGYELAYDLQRGFFTVYKLSSPFCVDCTVAGTNVKPDFW